MVGIKKTYFNDKSDDDWKYKIRCCKVISFVQFWDGKRVYHIEMILKSSKQINYSLEMQRVRKPKAVNGQSGTTMGNLTDGTQNQTQMIIVWGRRILLNGMTRFTLLG